MQLLSSFFFFFFSSRRRHTRCSRDWSSDVCSSDLTRRRSGGRLYYDAVVMDAPPTGRIGNFLNVATEVSGLAKVGPIRGHADTVQSVIKSPQTAVHFVTVLEEMPVQETLDGVAELRGL